MAAASAARITHRKIDSPQPRAIAAAPPPVLVVEANVVANGRELKAEEIAALAYSSWESRGGQGGSAEEDWLRAEQEMQSRSADKEEL